MVIVWAIVVAAAIILEVLTISFISSWFAGGGMIAMVMAAIGLDIHWQIIIFVVSSLALMASMRPILKKFLKTPTIPTNADANLGKEYKLTSDVVEGQSTINISGVEWTVLCKDNIKAGAKVVITEISGNKYKVKKTED